MSDEDGEFLTLVANRPAPGGESEGRTDEAVALGFAYATAKGQRHAHSLEFRRHDQSAFAIPYAYHPITWWHPPDTLLIEYPGFFTVSLTGTGLKLLADRIIEGKITWIRECEPALAASLPVAVTRIDILRAFPSRDAEF